MKGQMNKGEGFLKDKMKDYRIDPPEEVWDSISTRLGGGGRRRFVVLALVSAASIALAITLGINWFGPVRSWKTAEIEQIENLIPDSASGFRRESPVTESAPLPAVKPAGREKFSGPSPDGSGKSVQNVTVTRETKNLLASEDKQTEISGEIPTGSVPGHTEEIIVYSPDQTTESLSEVMAENFREARAENLSATDTRDLAESGSGPERIMSQEPEGMPGATDMLTEDTPRKKNSGWMIGASLSPLYSFRDAEAQYVSNTAGRESGTVAYAGGIQVGYRASGRLAIETGLFYNKMGIDIGSDAINILSSNLDMAPIGMEESAGASVIAMENTVGNIVSESGDIYVNNYLVNSKNENPVYSEGPDRMVNASDGIRQHLDYLEIPFNLRYTFLNRGIRLHLLGGISTNVLVNNYVSMEGSEGSTEIGYLTNIRTLNYSGNAGIGVSYHFLGSFSVSLEPRFRYFLNSVNDASLPSTRPYTFGIYTGLNYLF